MQKIFIILIICFSFEKRVKCYDVNAFLKSYIRQRDDSRNVNNLAIATLSSHNPKFITFETFIAVLEM